MPTKPGAIVEIGTRNGLAYAQCTHKLPSWGALLRVFEGFHKIRPPSFEMIVRGSIRFRLFFPLDTYVRRKSVAIVGREPVPRDAAEFPTFRGGIADVNGKVHVWWLWDGQDEWRLDGPLTEEQRNLPVRPGIWNDILLVERLESGWRPKDGS